MSTISSAASHQANVTGGSLSTLARALNSWWRAYINWRENTASINELRSMSDYEIKDIGLTRYDIARVAMGEGVIDRAFGRFYSNAPCVESTLP